MNRNDILTILGKHGAEIRHSFGVTRIRLFGSSARNDARPTSDIGIIIDIARTRASFCRICSIVI